jgi:hypothetical protein
MSDGVTSGPAAPPATPPDPEGATWRARATWTAAGPAIAALALLVAVVVAGLLAGTPNEARWMLLGLIGASWVVFAVAARAVLRLPVRTAVPLVLAGAVVLQVVAVAFPPRSTDDFYRYVWDGRVQASGTDPYRYPPVAPELAGLRDPWLFPPECRAGQPPCTRLNHPTDVTIYPPVAQGAFLAAHVASAPWPDDTAQPLQILAALLALGTTVLLVRTLRRVRGDPRRAVLWAWCPAVVLECGNNAHVDVLAALFLVAGLGAAATGRPGRAGIALGAAVATKILPLLALPAVLAPLPRRGDGRRDVTAWARRSATVLAGVVGVVVIGYVPHVMAVGAGVTGFLPAYLDEEGYGGGSRFALARLVLPGSLATVAGLAVLVAVTWWVLRRGDPSRPWEGAAVVTGTAFALGSVPYPWYGLLIAALVGLGARVEWLAVVAAAYPVYFLRALDLPLEGTRQVSYGTALALVAAATLYRRRRPV